MTVTLVYDTVLSRVRVSATLLGATASYAIVDRTTNGITFTTVRGAQAAPVVSENLTPAVDDYEFPDSVLITYRVRSFNAADVLQSTQTNTITPDLDGVVWVKSITRPFLNQPITVADFGDVVRFARNGVFAVVGRSLPVGVSDVRGSRQFVLQVLTQTLADAAQFDLVLASGDAIFLHTPAGSPVPSSHYAVIGSTTERRTGRISPRRLFDLPLTETAAPAATVVGSTSTYQTVLSTYATYTAVLAAHATYASILELIGSPTEVIVP